MNKFKILLIGFGGIGKRYFEGILSLNLPLEIVLVDKNKQVLEDTNQFILENDKIEVKIFNDFRKYEEFNNPDLIIDATPAENRVSLHKLLNKTVKTRYWIIEKLLVNSIQDLNEIRKIHAYRTGRWINTPRRMMKSYIDIKETFTSKSPVSMEVTGGNWNMGSNAIHFLDLLNFLTEDRNSVNFTHISCDGELYKIESRRKNYHEIMGQVKFLFQDGSSLKLVSKKNNADLVVTINFEDRRIEFNETKGVISYFIKNISIKQSLGELTFQSKMTPLLISSIILTGKCNLPNFESSYKNHSILLSGINGILNEHEPLRLT